MILRFAFILLISISLVSCSGKKTVYWKQQVQLQDSRVIEVNRISKQTGNIFPENVILEYGQVLSFTNPDTQEKITWAIPKGLMPRMIDFDQKIPYIVFRTGSVGDYNTWNCPNPPHIIFRYLDHKWQQITLDQLPARFAKPNTLDAAHSDDWASADGIVTLTEFQAYLDHAHPSLKEEVSTISRKKIHPIGHGCDAGTLYKLNRRSEINVPYHDEHGIQITPDENSFSN